MDLLADRCNGQGQHNADQEKKATPDIQSHVSLLSTPEYGCTQGNMPAYEGRCSMENSPLGLWHKIEVFGGNFAVAMSPMSRKSLGKNIFEAMFGKIRPNQGGVADGTSFGTVTTV